MPKDKRLKLVAGESALVLLGAVSIVTDDIAAIEVSYELKNLLAEYGSNKTIS